MEEIQSIIKKWISLKINEKYFATLGLNLISERHSSELISDKFSESTRLFFCWPVSFALTEAKSNSLQFKVSSLQESRRFFPK